MEKIILTSSWEPWSLALPGTKGWEGCFDGPQPSLEFWYVDLDTSPTRHYAVLV